MYDHPPSPRTSVVALAAPSTKLQRSHSPIPHISTLLPHHSHHLHHDRQYSPNSRQADISRLLDPAYASTSTAPGTTCSRAYVDHRGDLHDPDYRDFPVLPAKRRVTNSQKMRQQRRSYSANATLYAQQQLSKTARRQSSASTLSDRYSTYPLVARPEWERDWATEAEELDENEDEEDDVESQEALSPFTSSSASSSSSPTTSTSRRASMPPSIYERSGFFYTEPRTASATSSPVGSLEEQEEDHESPFEDAESASPKGKAASLLKRMKRCSSVDQHQQERQLEEFDETCMPEREEEEEEPFSNAVRDEQDDV